MSTPEKRQTSRRYADYVVEFYDPEGSMLIGVGHLVDLSPTGALVKSTVPMTQGQVLFIRLRRGHDADIELPITVVRVSRNGGPTYGVRFNRA